MQPLNRRQMAWRAGQDIDTGLRRLRKYTAAHHTRPLDRLCRDLARLLGDARDDITLMRLQIHER